LVILEQQLSGITGITLEWNAELFMMAGKQCQIISGHKRYLHDSTTKQSLCDGRTVGAVNVHVPKVTFITILNTYHC